MQHVAAELQNATNGNVSSLSQAWLHFLQSRNNQQPRWQLDSFHQGYNQNKNQEAVSSLSEITIQKYQHLQIALNCWTLGASV